MHISILSSLLLSAPVWAQNPTEKPVVEQDSAAVVIRTDLHAEYLVGERMLVRFEIDNQGSKTADFADLAARPWLVRFKVTPKGKKSQTRYNVPPKEDSNRRWSLRANSRKEVLLEIPSSSTFKAGEYTLEITILDDQKERRLPAHQFRIRGAEPVSGSISYEALGTSRGGHQVVWSHRAQSGFDLYLHHADGKSPQQTLGNYHLLHLKKPVEPVLAQAAPQQAWDRHIYWLNSKNSLSYVRLRGQTLRSQPVDLNFPYPSVELVDRGSTDGEGVLHVPFWVSAPNQKGGELRVASVDSRGQPRFRSVLRAVTKPDLIQTGVDSTGGLRILLGSQGALDMYKLHPSLGLPASGQRILPAENNVLFARIGFLPEAEGVPGGMAIGTIQKLAESSDDAQRVRVAWASVDGRELKSWPDFALPTKASIVDALITIDTYSVLIRLADGKHQLIRHNAPPKSVASDQLGALVPDQNGGVLLRRFVRSGPIRTSQP